MAGCCSCFAGLFGSKRSSIPEALRTKTIAGFEAKFGRKPVAMGVAPGRAEVLGNHTDYNEGFILAAAIDRYITIAGSRSDAPMSRLFSENFKRDTPVEFDVDKLQKHTGETSWANYVMGVVSELQKAGCKVCNFDAFISGDVPPGAGVSSSAAVELATGKLLAALFPDSVGKLEPLQLIKVCKAAENNFVGMGCGILDQFSSGMGKSGHLIFLDCRTCEHDYVPMKGAQFVLANTHAPHQLVDGKYMELRELCFEAADDLAKAIKKTSLTHLRDVSAKEFDQHSAVLAPARRRVSTHIIGENERVQQIVQALKEKNDVKAMGEAMSQSHSSSRNNFGNSCKELDMMHDCALGIDGCLGSRLMGGGFGGCTINLVSDGYVDSFSEELARRYKEKSGIQPSMLACKCGDGACFEKV